MALLILSDMAEREAELGYTTPSRSINTGTFSLPSLDDVGVFGDEGPRLANDDKQSTLSSKLSTTPRVKHIEPPSTPKAGEPREPAAVSDGESSTRSSTATPSPCPSPLAPPEPHDTPQTTFSTWLPDDSLRFINPRFLSTDEKETLQSQLGKRKSEEDEDHAGADQRGRSSILQADEGCSVPAKQSTLSSPTAIQSRTSRPTPTKHLPHPVMPSATDLSAVLAPSRSTLSRPSLGPRSRTTDLDLLRQVKSNNLSLPATSLYPPPYQSQPSPPYTLPPAYKVPPSSLPPRHPPHAYPLPFTHAPLVHPPLGDTGRQYHPPPSGNERLFARPQHGQYIFRPQHVQHTRVVHPPPAPVRWEESRSTTFPSVLQPISPPRHTYPQPTYPPDQVRQPKGGTSLSRQIPEVDRSPGKEGQGRVSAVEHRELG